MTEQRMNEVLQDLLQLDLDAVQAYALARRGVNVRALHDALDEMKRDHDRHVEQLGRVLTARGAAVPHGVDLKGALLGGMAALRALAGAEGALKALRQGEQLTLGRYAKALTMNWPDSLLDLVRRFHGDEHRHLATIERWLAERPWEGTGASAS